MTRVLLTGGSGFIAAHVLDQLLSHGHSVVTTVRSSEKAQRIASAHPNTPKEKLSFAIVPDIAVENAFDQAVISNPPFEAVIHTASPFHFNVTNIQTELLDPAVIGTTGILKSIKRYAPSVKRVVITSSFASVLSAGKGSWPEKTYSEADWNPVTQAEALENPATGYRASKTFAERAAWDFVKNENPNFELTTLCPPLVIGPVIHWLNSLDAVNTSNQRTRDLIQGKYKDNLPESGVFIWVDVRDLAACHVLAIEKSAAAGQRYLVSEGHFSNRDIAEIIRKDFPQYRDGLPGEEVTTGGYPEGGIYQMDNSKVVRDLGIKWRSLEQSVCDTVKSLQAVGV